MIKEYIDNIEKTHGLEQSEWMESRIRRALGPTRWWLIETTGWKWLARRFDVTINVRQVPDGNLVIIRHKGVEIAQREFPYNKEAA